MQLVYFTVVAIALYFVSDWLLRLIERARGETLPHRSLFFFAILLVLALVSFHLINRFAAG